METTEERIQTALLELMQEKRLEEITIIAIADRSSINRTTVYRHYVDKYAILQVIENNVLTDLNNRAVAQNNVLAMLKAINDKRAVISILLNEGGDPRFNDRFIRFLMEKGLKTIQTSPRFHNLDTRQKELLGQYISSALVGLVRYWLNHSEMSAQELADFFENLFKNGINSFTEL